MFFEWLYRKLMHKTQTLGDLSAAVTGILLAFVCPVTLPYWMLIVGNFFAIFVVKQLYGGLGKNFLNPALAGRAALVACYTSQMTELDRPEPPARLPLFGGADVVTAATPLAMMKGGEFAEALTAQYSLSDMFIGNIGGSHGRDLRDDAAHRRIVLNLPQGHLLADPRGLHRHGGSPHVPLPPGQRRAERGCSTTCSAAACSSARSSWRPTMSPLP